MIGLNQLDKQLKSRLAKLEVGGAIEVLTYKRNRGFVVVKDAENLYFVREHGYHEESYKKLDDKTLDKLVGRICKREFPRSTQVRIYTHEAKDRSFIIDQLGIKI